MAITSQAPIGVFDSGVGGLTVLRAIREHLPAEDLLYLGDTARVPYGTKGPDTVRRYAVRIAEHLRDAGCKAIVIACNTASAYGAQAVSAQISLPVFDVIRPASAYVVGFPQQDGARRRIAVLGTRGTVRSQAYRQTILGLDPNAFVVEQACPLFVPLAEEGWLDGPVPTAVAETYLAPLFTDQHPDSIVLGCTHYPLLLPVLLRTVAKLDPSGETRIVDSAQATARAVTSQLQQLGLARRSGVGSTRYQATDDPDSLVAVAERFLGTPINDAEHVDL